jgi:hypothetical protein
VVVGDGLPINGTFT